ncbi:MAG: EamA family transporter [Verrucomicrobiota bacterium]
MENWKLLAFLSALFAGLTSVLAKAGLREIAPDLGLTVRTAMVFVFIWINALAGHRLGELSQLTRRSWLLLLLSGVTTSLSWIFYYRAMKVGTVSFVSIADKGSILVTLALSFLILKEPMTWNVLVGATLVTAGLIVLTMR